MSRVRIVWACVALLSALGGGVLYLVVQRQDAANSAPIPIDSREIHFVPTGRPVLEKMLEAAEIKSADVVMDLGCGDGRLVIEAAKRFGCRGFGYDIDAELIARCKSEAQNAGVADLVEFHVADIYDLDISEATVVFLYLLPEMNLKLLPQLQTMASGSRVLSHDFEMPGVDSAATIRVEDDQPEMEGILTATTHWIHVFHNPILLDPNYEPDGQQFVEALEYARERGVQFSD